MVGACGKTSTTAGISEIAGAGAAAVVMKTVFQGTAQRSSASQPWELRHSGNDAYGDHTFYSNEPGLHTLDTYTAELKRASETVKIPVIASISCYDLSHWQRYAIYCEAAGAKAIELNVGCPLPHGSVRVISNSDRMAKIVSVVRKAVRIPIAVKLSPQTASPTALARVAVNHGANAAVLLNKFAGMDIDLEREAPILHSGFSAITGSWFAHIVRRWVADTMRNVGIDICATGGVVSGVDIAKYLLCGACCVQIAAPLYLQDAASVIRRLLDELRVWMTLKRYSNIAAFQGKAARNLRSGLRRRQSHCKKRRHEV